MVSGAWEDLKERTAKMLEDPGFYSIGNWATLGLFDVAKGSVDPEEPLSLEHWLNSIGFAAAVYGIYEVIKQVLAIRHAFPKDIENDFVQKNANPETVINSIGEKFDISRSENHKTTFQNPGYKGTPNSSVDFLETNGGLLTRRWFDENGNAVRDVDMTNHGNPKQHPVWPHEHFWTFDSDGRPKRR